jgi:hypothetical protein
LIRGTSTSTKNYQSIKLNSKTNSTVQLPFTCTFRFFFPLDFYHLPFYFLHLPATSTVRQFFFGIRKFFDTKFFSIHQITVRLIQILELSMYCTVLVALILKIKIKNRQTGDRNNRSNNTKR